MKDIPELNLLFNTAPVTKLEDPVTLPANSPGLSNEQQDDYDLARHTLRQVTIKGQNLLDDIMELSRNSEHPRSYEVAGQIMKTLSDSAKDLLELQKKVKEIKTPEKASKAGIGTQNNVVFAGSTAELMKMLRNNTLDG